MGIKKNDTAFGFQTRNMPESIDLCMMLFCYLYSRKNAFEKAKAALPFKKYIEFFRTLSRLGLFKDTRITADKKYQLLITALLNGETAESFKDEPYFFRDLENEVKIHNQDSKKQIKSLLLLSCFMVLFGFVYIFVFIKSWALTKSISPSEIIFEGLPAFVMPVLGGYFLYKCIMSLRVYARKEMNPIFRCWYHDIDLEYCFSILNSEMDRIYKEINARNYAKDLISQLKRLALEEIENAVNEINVKASSIEELSNNIGLLINPTEDAKLIDAFISYGAPLKKTPKGVRCAGSTNSLVHWIIEENYDDPGRVDWILENVKDKNGKRMNRETLLEYFRDNREIYRANKNMNKTR